MKLCKDRKWFGKKKGKYPHLYSTQHRTCDSFLKSFWSETVPYHTTTTYNINSYSEPLLLYALFYKYVNVTAVFAPVHSDVLTWH